jgi:predicted GNAT family acetyltransferase
MMTSNLLSQPFIRKLTESDEPAIMESLANDKGYGLFIASNILSYGFALNIHYWGQFASNESNNPEAILMIAGNGGTFYSTGANSLPLMQFVRTKSLHFIMGSAIMLDRFQQIAKSSIASTDIQNFAELPSHRFHRLAQPDGINVRQAKAEDIPPLVNLYQHAEGFAEYTYQQLQVIIHDRVSHFRTFIVERDGIITSVASTSAETAKAAMIGGVWTIPEYRGHGHSTAVVGALCKSLLA